jgi:biotin carboxylase
MGPGQHFSRNGNTMALILVVGFLRDVLRHLDGFLPAGSVVVVEEPDIVRSRGLIAMQKDFPCVAEIVEACYVQSDELVDAVRARCSDRPIRAVVPASEYAVPGAALLAAALGLPGAGVGAALIFRDKALLRAQAGRLGLHQPRWAEVTSAAEAKRFAAAEPGGTVLKPADRAGSIGVRFLDDAAAVTDALWEDVTEPGAPLFPHRPTKRRYLAEQRLRGPEFSVEMLVRDGVPLFSNVTEKEVWPGSHPVERGHRVPAVVPDPTRAALVEAMTTLARGSGLGTAFLHGEWIVDGAGPALVECAARTPGDRIVELIAIAYGFNPVEVLVQALSGDLPVLPAEPVAGAAIRFLHAAAGTVTGISGIDAARAAAGVAEVMVGVRTGDEVKPLASSFQRLGYVMACAPTSTEAARLADRVASSVVIQTRPDVPRS